MVKSALNATLLGAWIGNAQQGLTQRVALFRALQKNDFEHIWEIFFSFYASIPNDWFRNNREQIKAKNTPTNTFRPGSPFI